MSDVPKQIEKVGETSLRIVWADGHESVYSWQYLRQRCPCAVCKPYGDMGAPVPSSLPKADEKIHAVSVQPVGRYAVHVGWSDGHSTGIYAYDYLRRLCSCESCRPVQLDEG